MKGKEIFGLLALIALVILVAKSEDPSKELRNVAIIAGVVVVFWMLIGAFSPAISTKLIGGKV